MINLDNFNWGWMDELVTTPESGGHYLVHIDNR